MEIDNIKVEILTREESTKYLGQMVAFQQQETTSIKNRIRAARATFYKYKPELTAKSYFLRHRLRLFDMVSLIIQTKRKNDKKTQDKKEKSERGI